MFVSGEAWRLFKQVHPEQDFSDFWLEASLNFCIGCFDLSSFFLLRKKVRSVLSTPSSAKVLKTEPLSGPAAQRKGGPAAHGPAAQRKDGPAAQTKGAPKKPQRRQPQGFPWSFPHVLLCISSP
jgi:hypothetical protein